MGVGINSLFKDLHVIERNGRVQTWSHLPTTNCGQAPYPDPTGHVSTRQLVSQESLPLLYP